MPANCGIRPESVLQLFADVSAGWCTTGVNVPWRTESLLLQLSWGPGTRQQACEMRTRRSTSGITPPCGLVSSERGVAGLARFGRGTASGRFCRRGVFFAAWGGIIVVSKDVHEKANPPRGGGAKPRASRLVGEAAGPPKGEDRFVRKSPDADAEHNIGRAIVRPAVGAVGHLRGGCPGPDARPGGRPRGFPPRAVSASGRSSENTPSRTYGE